MRTAEQMAEQMAERIVDQWDNHDRYRVTDKALFENGQEPNEVAIARALIEALKEVRDFREFEGLS